MSRICYLVITVCLPVSAFCADIDIRDGDRVVWVGGTFVERMQRHGYLETMLTTGWPDRNITFRNLGWSGDNVFGHSRSVFGPLADGYKRLIGDLRIAKPTLSWTPYRHQVEPTQLFTVRTALP